MEKLKELSSALKTKNIKKLYKEYNVAGKHPKFVTRIALILFNKLKSVHGLKKTYLIYLYAASMLHDIGKKINKENHHKVSQTLIMTKLKGFTKEELLLIGNIARYHRSGLLPKASHSRYAELSGSQKKIVDACAAILSIADGIGKKDKREVKDIKIDIGKEITFTLYSNEDISKNLKSLKKKKKWFEKLFGKKLVFNQKPFKAESMFKITSEEKQMIEEIRILKLI